MKDGTPRTLEHSCSFGNGPGRNKIHKLSFWVFRGLKFHISLFLGFFMSVLLVFPFVFLYSFFGLLILFSFFKPRTHHHKTPQIIYKIIQNIKNYKTTILNKYIFSGESVSESRKEAMVYAYDLFTKWSGITWEKPIYNFLENCLLSHKREKLTT
jgi:hypothetical protein